MASAAFDGLRVMRSGIAAGRRRSGAMRGRSGGRPARRARMLRGAAATLLLASGYTACIAGVRWLLSLG